MISQQGQVVARKDDRLEVRIGASFGCPACDAGKGCGAGIFGRLLKNRPVSVQVPNEIDARVGDAVQVGIAESGFLTLVLRLYAFPLVSGLVGIALGYASARAFALGSLASDLSGLVGGFVLGSIAVIHSRARLREFPLEMAVNLLPPEQWPPTIQCRPPPPGARPDCEQELSKR